MFHLLRLAPLLAVTACTLGPDYREPLASDLGVPSAYGQQAEAAAPTDLARWWEQLGDPTLTRLVEDAAAYNLDILQAAARLRQAREALIQARADRVPTLGATGGVNQSFDRNQELTSLSIGADAAWTADLFGGISRNIEAARADAEGVYFDTAAIRIAIIGETASNYIQARQAQQRLLIARDSLRIADDNLQIARWRVQAGLVSSLDVEQARAQRAQTAATIPALEQSLAAAIHRLSVLTGRAPAALAETMGTEAPIPQGPDAIAAGIPADTLRQRPDVRSAERVLAGATARIGVAQAQLYPALRITGDIGSSALTVGGLADAITGGLFGGLTQTLFDGGRLRSQVRSQEAAAEGAFAAYKQAVLIALEDVENGLVAGRASRARQAEFVVAQEAASNTAILARSQYQAGLTDFTTLLQAEQSLLSSRDGLVSSGAERALALVQLYLALGGGWDPLASPEPDLRP